jgi:hypothetical protein
VHADEPGEHFDDATGANASRDVDRQALTRPLVDHREALEPLPVGAVVEDEVVCPNLVGAGRRGRSGATGRDTSARPAAGQLQPRRPPQPYCEGCFLRARFPLRIVLRAPLRGVLMRAVSSRISMVDRSV